MTIDRDFKGVWIPKTIWLAENLSWTEKMLLVEIDSLCRNNECFATNEYFAKFFNLKKDTISKAISSLKNKGYIEVKLEYKKCTRQVIKRIISTTNYTTQSYTPIGEKSYTPIGEKSYTPIGEKSYNNNTNNNNTNNIIITTSSSKSYSNIGVTEIKDAQEKNKKTNEEKMSEEIIDINSQSEKPKLDRATIKKNIEEHKVKNYIEQTVTSAEIKKKIYAIFKNRSLANKLITMEFAKLFLSHLEQYSDGNENKKLIILDQAIDRGYTALYDPKNYDNFSRDYNFSQRKRKGLSAKYSPDHKPSYDLDKYEETYDIFTELAWAENISIENAKEKYQTSNKKL